MCSKERLKAILNSVKIYARHPYLPDSRGFWIALAVAIPLVSTGGLIISGVFSEDFRKWLIGMESGGAAIRNVGLIIAAVTALPIAIWRGIVADKQSAANQRQSETSQRQADTEQRGLRNERYQKGSEMLGSESLSVRLGGIYALQRLAEEYPEEYHVQIMRLFCGFARHPTRDEIHERAVQSEPGVSRTRDDVKAILQAIGIRGEARIALEPKGEYWLDLENAYLMYVDLQGSNLAGANLRNADLSYSILWDANLRDVFALKTIFRNAKLDRAIFCNAFLIEADMSRATLIDARLEGVHLHMSKLENAILSGANLSGVIGLTQTRLDQARADPKNPPTLEGTLEAETGKQLEWKGKPLKDEA